jgi:hypothetical protein
VNLQKAAAKDSTQNVPKTVTWKPGQWVRIKFGW